MKNTINSLIGMMVLAILFSFTTNSQRLINKNAHIGIFSHTTVEDIKANNYKVTSTLDVATGEIVFSVPMQSFEFDKSLMQKHFNSPKFLDTKQFPKAKFKGKIIDLRTVNFSKDGSYTTSVKGDLTLHGVTKEITQEGNITVKGNNISMESTMNITLADYKILFTKGKPSSNIAKTIEATIKTGYTKE